MVNDKLLKVATAENLVALGLVEEHDGTGDPRGTSWNIRNAKYHLWIDAWCEVQLARRNPDTDFITLHVTDLQDLRSVIDWIVDEDDEKNYVCVGCEKKISMNETSKIIFCHCIECEKLKLKANEETETNKPD